MEIKSRRKKKNIEAKNETEAKEEMWNMIMDYPDFYIEIVAEDYEDEEVEEDEN